MFWMAFLSSTILTLSAYGFDGAAYFDKKCSGCHSIGEGVVVGPDLKGVTERRTEDWIKKFIRNSEALIASGDPIAKKLFNEYKIKMPAHELSDQDLKSLYEYLKVARPTGEAAFQSALQATASDIAEGKDIFFGVSKLEAGGPSCISCHRVGDSHIFKGGTIGPDLAQSYIKLQDEGIYNSLSNIVSPTMKAAFDEKKITDQENYFIRAYLADAANQTLKPSPDSPHFGKIISSIAIIFLGIIFLIFLLKKLSPFISWYTSLSLMLIPYLFGFIFPNHLLALTEVPARLYLLEGANLVFGLLTLIGIASLIFKKSLKAADSSYSILDKTFLILLLSQVLANIGIALTYRWNFNWYAISLVPYLQSLLKLKPSVYGLITIPGLVKFQIIGSLLTIILFPFSRFLKDLIHYFKTLKYNPDLKKELAQKLLNKLKNKKIIGLFFILFLVFLAVIITEARKVGLTQGYAPTQPIKFSHKVHAGDNQIQCLYCHYGAQTSRHAGVPPTELCMNCHAYVKKDSPEILKVVEALNSGKGIEWNKVNHFPDFAYFNHSQHVMVGKVACQQCHGEVQTFKVMKQQESLSMGQCIACHRQKEIMPPNDHKSKAGGDCAKCHY